MANYGFVYVMGHDYMPGVFKIGMTNQSPLRRRDELSSGTAIPSPFDLLFYIEVDGAAQIEKAMHDRFHSYRISENREFFQCDIREIHGLFIEWEADGAPMAVTNFGKEALYSADCSDLEINRHPEPADERTGDI